MAVWGCKQRYMKQFVPKPVEIRNVDKPELPGPSTYKPPEIIGAKGYNKIKRAPAYSFGHRFPLPELKPAANLDADILYDISGWSRKGPYKIPQGSIGILFEPPAQKSTLPGPAQYMPKDVKKTPPAYSLQPAAPKLKESATMWTPGPNMYWPPILHKNTPAYSFSSRGVESKFKTIKPAPGQYNPKYDLVLKTTPAYTFGDVFKVVDPKSVSPGPTAYCHHKFNLWKKSSPAPSFGIRHSPFLGQPTVFEKPANLNVVRVSADFLAK